MYEAISQVIESIHIGLEKKNNQNMKNHNYSLLFLKC